MSNQLEQLLTAWYPKRDDHQWLLATVVSTEGSSYRRPGAMMLFNDTGDQFGLVSGGCLESDVLKQACQCWQSGTSKTVTYDMREEGDLAWHLGIGCGGRVDLLLQPITADNQYLVLDKVLQSLQSDSACFYAQPLKSSTPRAIYSDKPIEADGVFTHQLTPAPTILVLGGGVDAIPVVQLGAQLGWKMWVNDPRPRYARRSDFSQAARGSNLSLVELAEHAHLEKVAASIVMHHNVSLDAEALQALRSPMAEHIGYIGLLGPSHRTERVFEQAGLDSEALIGRLANPIGLRLGGELPESLALSMMAEIHAWLHQQDGQSLGHILN